MDYPNLDDKINWIAFYQELISGIHKPVGTGKMQIRCPFHSCGHEQHPSFWYNTTNGCYKCEACGETGNGVTFLSKMKAIDQGEAYRLLRDKAGVLVCTQKTPAVSPGESARYCLADYASSKRFQMDFLHSLSIRDGNAGTVIIPYFDEEGTSGRTRIRCHPASSPRFKWTGSGPILPYGLWLEMNKTAKALILVEGESDSQALWAAGLPALGIPGASNFKPEWCPKYLRDRDVWLHIEPGQSGRTFFTQTVKKLYEGGYKGRAHTFSCQDADASCKDPSDLFIHNQSNFASMIKELLKSAKQVDLVKEGMTILQAVEIKPDGKQFKRLEHYAASSLFGVHLERPPVIVQGMIPVGLTILAGAPKRGKSWLALMLALSVAAGQPFLGMATMQGDVLYLDLESRQYRVQERLKRLIPGRAPDSLYVAHESDRLDGDLLAQLDDWCKVVKKPVLIILDTLGRVKGGSKRNENAYEGDTRILGQLQKFAMERKIAVLCVHHLRKSSADDDYFERVSGSMGITGACDTVMVLAGKRGEQDSELKVSSRDFESLELILGFNQGVWSLTSTDSEAYQKEREYNDSPIVRGALLLMQRRDRWEGKPSELVEEMARLTGVIPETTSSNAFSAELSKHAALLFEREGIYMSRSRTGKARRISLERINNKII